MNHFSNELINIEHNISKKDLMDVAMSIIKRRCSKKESKEYDEIFSYILKTFVRALKNTKGTFSYGSRRSYLMHSANIAGQHYSDKMHSQFKKKNGIISVKIPPMIHKSFKNLIYIEKRFEKIENADEVYPNFRNLSKEIIKLSPIQQKIIKMKFCENYTVKEIAKKLKLTQKKIYTRIQSSLAKLRQYKETQK